ncbi:MAG: sugar porter family MFS transporter [Bacteroidetes bacterium]|nr:sugar porter family MFS transporter [Bacteroidota bacterium]
MLAYPVRIALIAALGGFLFGFETAVISGAESTIEKMWSLNSFWQGFTVASSLIGTVVGSLIAGIPAKKYGRKKVLMTIAVMYVFAAIGCASISTWILFVLFRFIGGIAVGASSVVGPMYISEISPAKLRGRLAGSFQLNIVIGIFVALTTNFLFKDFGENSWRWMLGVMVIPAALFFILVRYIPESPRWLILNYRDAEAIPIMQRIGEMNTQKAIEDIRLSVSHHEESLFRKKYIKPILFAMLLAMFNQLSGINALFYYAPRIFEIAGFDKSNSYLQPIYLGAANLVFTLLAMSVIDKFGRKKLLLIGSVGMIIFLALTGFSIAHPGENNGAVIFYLIGFIAFFAFSQGAVVWVFISEIFPNSVRSQGGSLGSFTHWIMAAIISWIFPAIAKVESNNVHTGVVYAFYFFAFMMLVHLFFVWIVMPETKGKSLETIQKELGIE